VVQNLVIEQSSQENSALLGAAQLYLETKALDEINSNSFNLDAASEE
jgi:hypothetical protein